MILTLERSIISHRKDDSRRKDALCRTIFFTEMSIVSWKKSENVSLKFLTFLFQHFFFMFAIQYAFTLKIVFE